MKSSKMHFTAPFLTVFLCSISSLSYAIQTGVTSLDVSESEVNTYQEHVIERRIDSIDVTKLAKSAYLLHTGQMMSQYLYLSAKGNLKQFLPIISKVGLEYNIEPELIAAVILTESDCISNAVSKAGAKGLMQLMPNTAKELNVVNIFDPYENIKAGSIYLKQQLDEFKRVDLALAAYNAGPGNVKKYNGIPPFSETKEYVKKVKQKYGTLKQKGLEYEN